MLINPNKITDFKRTDAELEVFALFAVVVAGKKAAQMAQKLAAFLEHQVLQDPGFKLSPFMLIRDMVARNMLEDCLKEVKMGQYKRIAHTFKVLASHDAQWLRWCSVQQLEDIAGIGPKTARFFILHSREGARMAVLDTHILRFMREELEVKEAPKSTPPAGTLYKKLEQMFLVYCDEAKFSIAEFDLFVWRKYSLAGKARP